VQRDKDVSISRVISVLKWVCRQNLSNFDARSDEVDLITFDGSNVQDLLSLRIPLSADTPAEWQVLVPIILQLDGPPQIIVQQCKLREHFLQLSREDVDTFLSRPGYANLLSTNEASAHLLVEFSFLLISLLPMTGVKSVRLSSSSYSIGRWLGPVKRMACIYTHSSLPSSPGSTNCSPREGSAWPRFDHTLLC